MRFKNALIGIPPFFVELGGLSQSDRWLFLNVTKGDDIISEIHEVLHSRHFSRFKPSWLKEYKPHLTVGQFNSACEARKVYELEKHLAETFTCTVNKISVEVIGENEESIVESEHRLG